MLSDSEGIRQFQTALLPFALLGIAGIVEGYVSDELLLQDFILLIITLPAYIALDKRRKRVEKTDKHSRKAKQVMQEARISVISSAIYAMSKYTKQRGGLPEEPLPEMVCAIERLCRICEVDYQSSRLNSWQMEVLIYAVKDYASEGNVEEVKNTLLKWGFRKGYNYTRKEYM